MVRHQVDTAAKVEHLQNAINSMIIEREQCSSDRKAVYAAMSSLAPLACEVDPHADLTRMPPVFVSGKGQWRSVPPSAWRCIHYLFPGSSAYVAFLGLTSVDATRLIESIFARSDYASLSSTSFGASAPSGSKRVCFSHDVQHVSLM
jgi:hypothetical protein